MFKNVCTLQSRFLTLKIDILRHVAPMLLSKQVCGGTMQTPATRKVCVGKMQIPATRKICVLST